MGTAAAVVGGSVVGGVLSSRSQRKAADKQADAIKDGQKISSEAAAQAREDVLSSYAPAFKDIATGVQNARNDLLAGRVSTQDILNRSIANAANTIKTSTQQSMQALLGSPSQTPQAAAPATQKSNLSQLRTAPFQAGSQVSMPGISQEDIDSIEVTGRNQAVQKAIAADPYLSARHKEMLTNFAKGSPEGELKGLGRHYENMTGGKFSTFKEARDHFQNEQILSGESPVVSGGITETAPMADIDTSIQAPQGRYGLSGAESALRKGMIDSESILKNRFNYGQKLADIGFETARGDITDAQTEALGSLRGAADTGRGNIRGAAQQALGFYSPFRKAGEGAMQREAALTGALGPEAQAEAFAQYSESPGQRYLREQQEKALLRSSAAIGGLGGGNVRTALQEQAAGIASQNYQQDLENLRSLAGRGQQAAGASAEIAQQRGTQLANIAQQLGLSEAQVQQSTGDQLAQLAREKGLTSQQAQQLLGSNLAQTRLGAQQQISGLRYGAGQDISRMLAGAGGQL